MLQDKLQFQGRPGDRKPQYIPHYYEGRPDELRNGMPRGALVTAGRYTCLNITMGAAGGPQSDRSLAGAPRGSGKGRPSWSAMQRRPGYVMDLGIIYRGAL